MRLKGIANDAFGTIRIAFNGTPQTDANHDEQHLCAYCAAESVLALAQKRAIVVGTKERNQSASSTADGREEGDTVSHANLCTLV
jgi:hypothetical protein